MTILSQAIQHYKSIFMETDKYLESVIIGMWRQGNSNEQIALHLGVTEEYVINVILDYEAKS